MKPSHSAHWYNRKCKAASLLWFALLCVVVFLKSLNLGLCTCQASAVPQSGIASPSASVQWKTQIGHFLQQRYVGK